MMCCNGLGLDGWTDGRNQHTLATHVKKEMVCIFRYVVRVGTGSALSNGAKASDVS